MIGRRVVLPSSRCLPTIVNGSFEDGYNVVTNNLFLPVGWHSVLASDSMVTSGKVFSYSTNITKSGGYNITDGERGYFFHSMFNGAYLRLSQLIDFTRTGVLKFDYGTLGPHVNSYLQVWINEDETGGSVKNVVYQKNTTQTATFGTAEIDVSNYQGRLYLGFYVWFVSTSFNAGLFSIDNVRFEGA